MKLKIAIIVCFITMCKTSKAQVEKVKAQILLQNKLSLLEKNKQYDSIVYIYTKTNLLDTTSIYFNHSTLAKAYFKLNKNKKGFEILKKSIQKKVLNSPENLQYNYKEMGLDSLKEYQELKKNFDVYYYQIPPKINEYAVNVFNTIFSTDQSIRNFVNDSDDSIKLIGFYYAMHKVDSLNAVELTNLIKKLGHFPGKTDLDYHGSYSIFIIKHLESYLDMDFIYKKLKEATLAGEIRNHYVPQLIDMIRYQNKKPSLFGSFRLDYGIEDIENLDKRRAEYLLLPLWQESEVNDEELPKGYQRK